MMTSKTLSIKWTGDRGDRQALHSLPVQKMPGVEMRFIPKIAKGCLEKS